MFWISSSRPSLSKSSQSCFEQVIVSIPLYFSGISPVIFPFSSITLTISRPCFLPKSKSTGEWAGVTLTAPVPTSISTLSSAITGISLFCIGSNTFFPTYFLYLSSLGFTATALSPSIVSGLVVATIIYSSLLPTTGYFINANIPLLSSCSVSISANAVLQLGQTFTILLSLYTNPSLNNLSKVSYTTFVSLGSNVKNSLL